MNERALERARYVSLATFRRDGREVRTPIWMAGTAPRYYAFSAGDAGKVKRVRSTARVRLATCTARGRVTGEWVEARARILGEAGDVARAYATLRAKYGLLMQLTDVFARLAGRYQRRALLEIVVAEQS